MTATLFAAGTGVVLAQSQPTPPPPPPAPAGGPGPAFRERMLQRFDANHDGKLDESERAAAREEWKKMRAEHGGPGGHHGKGHPGWGAPGPDDFGPGGMEGPGRHLPRALRKQLAKLRHHQVMKRFDHDHDGRLNDAEYAEATKARDEMRARAKDNHQAILARFDANHDGKLDESERKEVRNAWQEFVKARPVLPAPAPATPPAK